MRCGWLTVAVLMSCRPTPLENVTSSLRFEVPTGDSTTSPTPTLQFSTHWADGVAASLPVNVVNTGRVALNVTWSELVAPLSAELPATLEPGSTSITVHLTPTIAGTVSQQLTVSASGVAPAQLRLLARVVPIPTCTPSGPCVTARFDVSKGACVEDDVPDGVTCDPATRCQLASICQTGRCVGPAVPCDDQNLCTIDICYPETGCEHVPAPPCPGDGRCQVGQCDPVNGCQLAPAEDGTRCGLTQSCTAADVCIEGACVTRDPPDGFICEEASPCRDEGRCQGERCVHRQPEQTLQPTWSFDSAATALPDGGSALQYQDLVLEPDGQLSLSGFFNHSPAILRANTLPVRAPEGDSRRCILWNGRLVCADYPSNPNGRVTALDLTTGTSTWTYDIRKEQPALVGLTNTIIFLARLVVQSNDRLAALYEGYPKGASTDGTTQCRIYFLAVIDASGRAVTAQRVTDPLLDECDHPHPYGVASDAIGNLYIAFSPTHSVHAPLFPDTPTLITSFSRDGIFRWKRLEATIRGGELAIAKGLLYPENSQVVLDAPTGQARIALPTELGRAVISESRLIPAPTAGGTTLNAFEAGQAQLRWSNTVPTGWTYWTDQLRLAQWSTSQGPRTVATSFVVDSSGVSRLYAVDTHSGLTAFSCPVALQSRTPPQIFEIANGSLAVMTGALDSTGQPACGKCDPPYALSSGAFQTLSTPGLSVAHEPWSGTFGGADHDHHED